MFKENGNWVWEPNGEPATLHCYMCLPLPERMNEVLKGPERKVVDCGVSNLTDPTEWYKLDCGHVVI